jgi:hypothetical protein
VSLPLGVGVGERELDDVTDPVGDTAAVGVDDSVEEPEPELEPVLCELAPKVVVAV